MNALVKTVSAPGLTLLPVPDPKPGEGQVVVRVKATSLCGTDAHIYRWDEWAQSRVRPPRIIGHEMCGEVAEVGRGVSSVKVGDYVAVESHFTCGLCFQCRTGQAHVCKNYRILGIDLDGSYADFVLLPERLLWKTSREIPPEIACVQEPLGNAVDAALEMSGDPAALHQTFRSVKNGGRVTLFGIPTGSVCFDLPNEIIFKGIRVYGVTGRRLFGTWYRLAGLFKAGLDIRPVVTHRFPLADYVKGFDLIQSGQCGKVVLFP